MIQLASAPISASTVEVRSRHLAAGLEFGP